jgi:hypothetical protein
VIAGAAAVSPAHAQSSWRADLGLTNVRPVGGSRVNAAAISALAQQQIGPVTPTLSAAATLAGDSVAAAQILMGVNWLPPWTNRAPLDFGAVVALYGIVAGDRGQSRTGYVRQHWLGERGGLWVGGAVAQIDRANSHASNTLDVGIWTARGRARLTAVLSTTRTTDRELFAGPPLVAEPFARRLRVADVTASLDFVGQRFDFEAGAGVRAGVSGLDGAQGFAGASLGWRVGRFLRLVVGAGSQLSDPLRGTPSWRYISAGVRVASPRSTRIGVPRGRAGPAVEAERMFGGRVRIVAHAPSTVTSVEIAGTLTGWQPVLLDYEPDGWMIELDVPAGPHRVQVRVNGGEWRVRAALRRDRDSLIAPPATGRRFFGMRP